MPREQETIAQNAHSDEQQNYTLEYLKKKKKKRKENNRL